MKKFILFVGLYMCLSLSVFAQVWSAVPGNLKGCFSSMIVYKGNLYVAGIDSLNNKPVHLIRWNGSEWSEIDTGLAGTITVMATYKEKLYAGTQFVEGKETHNYLMCWNDTVWRPITSFNGQINALCGFAGELYVGGKFTHVDTINARYIAKWNDTIWKPVGRGLPNNVRSLIVFHQKIYAGGQFKAVYRWMGRSWEDAYSGKGMMMKDGYVKSFIIFDDELYACGEFNYLAKWSSETWSVVGSLNDGSNIMCVYNGAVYTGGDFTSIPNFDRAYHIGKFSAVGWECLGGVIYWPGDCKQYTGTVWSMAEYKGDLYIGGQFMIAGGKIIRNFAKWNCPQQSAQ